MTSTPALRGPRLLAPLLVLALAAAGTPRLRAQTPPKGIATVTASVTVAPPPILLSTTRDLQFGNVGAGQTVSVPAQPPYTAGTWSAAARFGNMRKTVRYGVRFTLPTVLSNGTATMPVSFAGTQFGWLCVWNTTTSTASSCDVQQTNFDPSLYTASGSNLVIDLPNNTPGNGNFASDIYVGGQLTVPTGTLKPGTYTAPITITMSVIG